MRRLLASDIKGSIYAAIIQHNEELANQVNGNTMTYDQFLIASFPVGALSLIDKAVADAWEKAKARDEANAD